MSESASSQYRDYVLDLLEPIGEITARRFFGGTGLVSGTKQFAMIMSQTLYFCVDDTSREKYIEAGSEPFSYTTKKGKVLVKRYYEVPEEVFENPDELLTWADEAITVAEKS